MVARTRFLQVLSGRQTTVGEGLSIHSRALVVGADSQRLLEKLVLRGSTSLLPFEVLEAKGFCLGTVKVLADSCGIEHLLRKADLGTGANWLDLQSELPVGVLGVINMPLLFLLLPLLELKSDFVQTIFVIEKLSAAGLHRSSLSLLHLLHLFVVLDDSHFVLHDLMHRLLDLCVNRCVRFVYAVWTCGHQLFGG